MQSLARPSSRGSSIVAACVLAASSFAACSNAAKPIIACPQSIPLFTATLVQPPNGATGVSTSIGTIVAEILPSNSPGLGGDDVVLSAVAAPTIQGGPFTEQFPAPVPGQTSYPTYAATIPTLAPQTTYAVSATVPRGSGPCPNNGVWEIGSFTTQ